MGNTFCAYIDESGDEGFSFERGSSKWFVLSAVITRKENDLPTVKLVDEIRNKLGRPPKKPLHFRDLRHEHRLPLIDSIAKANLKAISILVHKPTLKEPEKFRPRFRLYFYAARFLFERISWYCRDHRTRLDKGDGTAEMIFSNRSGMSYEELRGYMAYLREKTDEFNVTIDWNSISPNKLKAYSPGRRMGLQIADAVAGAFFYAIEPTVYGFTEDRYARMLKPVVYNYRGVYLGYGIKLWPRESSDLIRSSVYFGWLREVY